MNPTAEGELLEAVKELAGVVHTLNNTLEDDYAKRSEIEQNYPPRSEVRRARIYFAIAVVVGLIASSLFTIGTISGCFLSVKAAAGDAPSACRIFPGYKASSERGQTNLQKFFKLLDEIAKNKAINARQARKIDELENRIEELERPRQQP